MIWNSNSSSIRGFACPRLLKPGCLSIWSSLKLRSASGRSFVSARFVKNKQNLFIKGFFFKKVSSDLRAAFGALAPSPNHCWFYFIFIFFPPSCRNQSGILPEAAFDMQSHEGNKVSLFVLLLSPWRRKREGFHERVEKDAFDGRIWLKKLSSFGSNFPAESGA